MSVHDVGPGLLVAKALLNDDSLGHAVIEVDELDGKITLKGLVESEQMIPAVEALASQQEGVVLVVNELVCERS